MYDNIGFRQTHLSMWADYVGFIQPVQAVTEDIFIRTVRPRRSVNCF